MNLCPSPVHRKTECFPFQFETGLVKQRCFLRAKRVPPSDPRTLQWYNGTLESRFRADYSSAVTFPRDYVFGLNIMFGNVNTNFTTPRGSLIYWKIEITDSLADVKTIKTFDKFTGKQKHKHNFQEPWILWGGSGDGASQQPMTNQDSFSLAYWKLFLMIRDK